MLTPLLIGDALKAIGVPGSIALLVAAAVLLLHGRSLLESVGQLSIALKTLGGVALVALAAGVGLIPGVDVAVAADRLGAFLASVWAVLVDGVGATLEAVGVRL